MTSKTLHEIPWHDPLDYARGIPESETSWILLYSSMRTGFTGRYSFLALRPNTSCLYDDFSAFEAKLSTDQGRFENAWFGYLGYGLKNALEQLPQDVAPLMPLPNLWMVQYALILVFDHDEQRVSVWAATPDVFAHLPSPRIAPADTPIYTTPLQSNMGKAEYLTKVAAVKEAIHRGDLYQANITRKFSGQFSGEYNPFALFTRLTRISPAPYSSFLKLEGSYILSSSPELFLKLDAQGRVETRPIKGSAPRYDSVQEDERSRENLRQSEKNRAENLMIVDLMRNDLSRHCVPGSVVVDSLFDVTSYATVHHMASTIRGRKQVGVPPLALVKGCFPPGSMTGAPKIKAMELCSEMEPQARGVYSGAIGWFSGDGACELSVVIRTLVIQDGRFEFQVGGAIVADSDPIEEWRETLTKAKGIATALGITMAALEGV